jgi:heme oxygenase
MLFFQNYICDSHFVSRDLQDKLKKKLFNSQYKYKALEEEIVQSKHWPPVSSWSGLADVFQRLDSAQTIDHDRTSLMSSLADSASETGSIHIEHVESEAAQREVLIRYSS